MITTTYPHKRTASRPVCPDFGVRKRGYVGSAVRMVGLSLVTQRNRREGLRFRTDKPGDSGVKPVRLRNDHAGAAGGDRRRALVLR